MRGWNRCTECGRMIGLDEFCGNPPKAVNNLLTPSAQGTDETWDTYHILCRTKSEPSPNQLMNDYRGRK